jgi:hypothetical protein
MTLHDDTGSGTLLRPPETDELRIVHEPTPAAPLRMRFVIPIVALIIGALAVLAVWTLAQSRMVDGLVDTPRALSDHDSHIARQLRERPAVPAPPAQHDSGIAGRLRAQDSGAQAQTAQLDPWIRNQLREQNPAGQAVSGTGSTVTQPSQSQHDSGISAQLRARTGNAAGCVPAAPGAGGWEARLAYGC